MMGASGGSGESATELLRTLTDPQAYADRLKGLDEKLAVASNILEQAKQENTAAAAERQQAEETNANTLQLVQDINAKQAQLQAREAWVEDGKNQINIGNDALNKAKADFDAKSKETTAALDKRDAAITKREQDYQDLVDKLYADAKQTLATQQAALESDYQAKAAAVSKREAVANAAVSDATAAKEAAEQTRLLYEAKLADLKKLVSA